MQRSSSAPRGGGPFHLFVQNGSFLWACIAARHTDIESAFPPDRIDAACRLLHVYATCTSISSLSPDKPRECVCPDIVVSHSHLTSHVCQSTYIPCMRLQTNLHSSAAQSQAGGWVLRCCSSHSHVVARCLPRWVPREMHVPAMLRSLLIPYADPWTSVFDDAPDRANPHATSRIVGRALTVRRT
jgi:hypothetical protein